MKPDQTSQILDGYADDSSELVVRFENISSQNLYSIVWDCLPTKRSRIADIGAGTGRDAAWFARQGHRVLAVEPVEAFRIAGRALHGATNIDWLDDCLPGLEKTLELGAFDLVTLCGVWQHLDDDARRAAIVCLAQLVAPDGTLIMSLRHGIGHEKRRVFPVDASATIDSARAQRLMLTRQVKALSVQTCNRDRGVDWTWLVFRKVDDRPPPENSS